MPAFPPRPPGLSAPPTPTPGAASVTQLGSHPPTKRTRGSPANTWLARKHFAPSGQARSVPAWSPPGPTHNAAPHPPGLLCPSKLGFLPHPGSWGQGAQPKLLGTEPRAPCLPSPELQLGDGALQGPAATGSEGHGASSGAAEARPGLPSRYPRARPTAGLRAPGRTHIQVSGLGLRHTPPAPPRRLLDGELGFVHPHSAQGAPWPPPPAAASVPAGGRGQTAPTADN